MQDAPNCLVLDEPTNHLDIDSIEVLEDALERFDGTVIAVSHDRYFLDRIADRIVLVADGAVRSFEGGWSANAGVLVAAASAGAAAGSWLNSRFLKDSASAERAVACCSSADVVRDDVHVGEDRSGSRCRPCPASGSRPSRSPGPRRRL